MSFCLVLHQALILSLVTAAIGALSPNRNQLKRKSAPASSKAASIKKGKTRDQSRGIMAYFSERSAQAVSFAIYTPSASASGGSSHTHSSSPPGLGRTGLATCALGPLDSAGECGSDNSESEAMHDSSTECKPKGRKTDNNDLKWCETKLIPHAYNVHWNELRQQQTGVLTIGGLYCPGSATDEVWSSRTSATGIIPRMASAGYHIINLVVGQPSSNASINQKKLLEYITSTDEGLHMSMHYVSSLMAFVGDVHYEFPLTVPVVYFGGEISQLAARRVIGSDQRPGNITLTATCISGLSLMMWSTGSTENIYCFGVDGLHMSAALMHHGDPMWRAALDADFALATAAMKTHLCDVKTKIHDIEAIAHMVNANLSSQTQQREAALQQVLQRLQITAAELSIMPSRIRSIKYQDWTSVEATDALSFFLATFGKKEILRCIEARMSWSFFCAATHNLFIKLLARPDCTVDKAIELLASNFGSNAHKAGGIAILASARPDCTFDKAIQLLASPFGSNAHKADGIAILASLLARPDCTFELAVQLLSSDYGSNAHKEHGKAALASMLSQLAALEIKDSFVIVTEILTAKMGSLHPNVQSFIKQSREPKLVFLISCCIG